MIIFILFHMYEGDADQKIKCRGSMPFWVYIKQRKNILMKKAITGSSFARKLPKKVNKALKALQQI